MLFLKMDFILRAKGVRGFYHQDSCALALLKERASEKEDTHEKTMKLTWQIERRGKTPSRILERERVIG